VKGLRESSLTRGCLQFNGQHPLRDRARKLDKGILVIRYAPARALVQHTPSCIRQQLSCTPRFEVPFNLFCSKCGEMIAQGVRFNAEKKQVGNYHSTKILSFSMRHHCGSIIVIETDPKNAEYIVKEGARKKVGCRPSFVRRMHVALVRRHAWHARPSGTLDKRPGDRAGGSNCVSCVARSVPQIWCP
jgi:hypothetical protein